MKQISLFSALLFILIGSDAFASYYVRCGKKSKVIVALDYDRQNDKHFLRSRLCKKAREGLYIKPVSRRPDLTFLLESEEEKCLYTFVGIGKCIQDLGETYPNSLIVKGISRGMEKPAEVTLDCFCVADDK